MKYVLCNCDKGGICRNIKNIITSLRYKDYYNLGLIIYWPKFIKVMGEEKSNNKKHIHIKNIDFYDIFDKNSENYIIINEEKELKKYDININIYTWEIKLLSEELKILPDRFSELQYLIQNDYNSISYEYNNIPNKIKENIIPYIKKINFNKNLLNIVGNFIDNNFTKNIINIGITIRTWPEHLERRKWYNIQNYINKIDKLITKYNEYNIFVCSDSNEPLEILKNKYNIITYKNIDRKRGGSYNINIDDIIDLLILCKCDIVIGCLTSNWCELIWYLTEYKIKIETINEIYNNQCLEMVKKGQLQKYKFIIPDN